MTVPDGERIAVLETQYKSILEELREQRVVISAMNDTLTQAKGVRWLLATGAAFAGIVGAYLPWLAEHIGIVKNG